MNNKSGYKEVKRHCIPNLSAMDEDGNIYPVVTSIQAQYEWGMEYRRAERYRMCCIVEMIAVGFLSMAILLRGNV